MKRIVPLLSLVMLVLLLVGCAPSYVKPSGYAYLLEKKGDRFGWSVGSFEILRVDRQEGEYYYVCTIGYSPHCGYIRTSDVVVAAQEEVDKRKELYSDSVTKNWPIIAVLLGLLVAFVIIALREKSPAEKIAEGVEELLGKKH